MIVWISAAYIPIIIRMFLRGAKAKGMYARLNSGIWVRARIVNVTKDPC